MELVYEQTFLRERDQPGFALDDVPKLDRMTIYEHDGVIVVQGYKEAGK